MMLLSEDRNISWTTLTLTFCYKSRIFGILIFYYSFHKLIVTECCNSFSYWLQVWINKPTVDEWNVQQVKHNTFWCVLKVWNSKHITDNSSQHSSQHKQTMKKTSITHLRGWTCVCVKWYFSWNTEAIWARRHSQGLIWRAADCSSTSGQTRRSYVGRSWQSWCVGSAVHYEPLILADDYECRPTAGRTFPRTHTDSSDNGITSRLPCWNRNYWTVNKHWSNNWQWCWPLCNLKLNHNLKYREREREREREKVCLFHKLWQIRQHYFSYLLLAKT